MTEQLRFERNEIEVTSACRPDETWLFEDASGHKHRWFQRNRPMTSYDHTVPATLPTLESVRDPDTYDEDGEPIRQSHWECGLCREVIVPGFRADDTRCFVPGLLRIHPITLVASDEEVASYITLCTSGEKTIITYGGYRLEVFITSVCGKTVTVTPIRVIQ